MLELKTILVPVDFSERGDLAVAQAVELAEHFDANVVLAHAIPVFRTAYANFEAGAYVDTNFPSDEELAAGAERQLDQLIESHPSARPIAKLVLRGDPAAQIVEQTQKMDIGLVVLPTHGYGAFRRFVLGSVTAKVLHDVKCPVLTGAHVPEMSGFQHGPIKHVACAVDLEDGSKDILRWARDFSDSYSARLTVLHAAPEVEMGGLYGDWLPPETLQMMLGAARERTEELVRDIGSNAHIEVESAKPATFVRELLEREPADVLVIGRSSDDKFFGRLRTHAYSIVRESPCPVISV